MKARRFLNPRSWAYGLFWSWNIIFLVFMALGFAPQVLPELIQAVRAGFIPAVFLVYAAVLTLIPVIAMIVGLTILRHSPGRLLAFGYGFEGPLMLLLAGRFFVIRQANPAVTLLLAISALGAAAFLWQLFDRQRRGPLTAYPRMIGLTLLLLAGLYAGVWVAFYAVPLPVALWDMFTQFVRDLFSGHVGIHWRSTPFWFLGTLLALYSGTLFVAIPVGVPLLYLRAWWRGARAFVADQGRLRAVALTALVVLACAGLFVWANRQPQHRAFALLQTVPHTPEEAQALLSQQETIRDGLLNAYLAPYRYISAVGEVRHVREMYKYTFDIPEERAAQIQHLYETVARPLLYQPVEVPETSAQADNVALRQEPEKAAKLYRAFFDQSILDGEHDAVVRAMRSTWMFDQARDAVLAVDDQEIHLERQEVTVTGHGDWAEVELYEVYQNRTGQRQEVVYYFGLPESAAITGLWLGESADRTQRFAYHVAPRGAAQETYRRQVRYNLDPALVEQIGPRQYRLRVFPVEPQNMRWDEETNRSTVEEGSPLHMWLTYRVLAAGDTWPLPRLAQKGNVYWDADTTRLVNGAPMAATEDWLPPSVPADAAVEPLNHRVDFPGGESVIARPLSQVELPLPGHDLRLAVVLDRSRSMVGRRPEVRATLERLAQVTDGGEATDVYLTVSEYHGEEPSLVTLNALDPGGVIYYGGQNAAELLAQFDALHTDQSYDAIVVLTDDSGYGLSSDEIDVPIPDAPVWMVHLGGDLPLGYDDSTLQALQASGGGVVDDVDALLARLAATLGEAPYDVIDGYAWSVVADETARAAFDGVPVDDGFATLAARQLILAHMVRQRGEIGQLETLDRLHAIATEYGIVTPYSSMIVLVNKQQEKMLEKLEESDDRFQREYEEVGETQPEDTLTVTGVPEPETWLLILLAAVMLIGYAWRTKWAPQRSPVR